MKSVYIREYKHYSQSEILEILGNNDEIFNRLQEYEIVAIDKDHRMPIRSFAEKSFIKIEQDACWVAVCIPVPPTNGLLRSEGKYRIDYSVKIDSGIEVGFRLLVSEEEFSYAIAGREDLWKLIMGKDVEKLFSLPGFDNYCERL